mgnify:CR=1 FL=1|jgi:GT2 family glycosyltransferase
MALLPITVVCCTRRRTDFLRACLKRVVNQDLQPQGVVVVENDRTPQSEHVVKAVASMPGAKGIVIRYILEP